MKDKHAAKPRYIVLIAALSAVNVCAAEFVPVAILGETSDNIIVVSDYTDNNSQGGSVWKINDKGERNFFEKFSGADGEEIISAIASRDGGCIILGIRFLDIDESGYYPFLLIIKPDGTLEKRANIDTPALTAAILQLDDGSILIGGVSDNPAKPDSKLGDAWIANVDLNGTIQWQKWLDHGTDEMVYAFAEGANGEFYGLARAGELDKFGSGESEAWLFKFNKDGEIQQEVTVPDGRFVTEGGDGLLIANANSITLVCSVPQDMVSNKSRGMFSVPARIVSFSSTLEKLWAVDYGDNNGTFTPLLASGQNGNLFLATASPKLPVLASISPQGKVEDEFKGKKFPFRPLYSIGGIFVRDNAAFVVGVADDVMSDDEETGHPFVSKFELPTGKLAWQHEY